MTVAFPKRRDLDLFCMPRTGLSSAGLKEIAMQLAVDEMRAKGFEKVRLTDIAREMRISHAALYAHFVDKSALLDAVSERWLRDVEQRLEDICRERRPALVKVRAWVMSLYRQRWLRASQDPELFKAFSLASETQKAFVRRHDDHLRKQLMQLVKEGLAKKTFKKGPPEKIVDTLLASTAGFCEPKLLMRASNEKRDALLKQVLDAVLTGLAPS